MSLYDYDRSREVARADLPFAALIMAALWKADGGNRARLAAAFPDVVAEHAARYDAPSGVLPTDPGAVEQLAARLDPEAFAARHDPHPNPTIRARRVDARGAAHSVLAARYPDRTGSTP